MGAVYTNTENAIRCSDNIEGVIGPLGDRGTRGITGNNWAYMAAPPSAKILTPFDAQGNLLPTNTGAVWPMPFDKWLNYTTGEWYMYDGTTWDLQATILQGPKGPDNIAKTDVSFSKNHDTRGFTVSTFNEDVLVGHVIFPGTTLAGAVSSVQILTHCNTGGENIKVTLKLVNINGTEDVSDDDIIASTVSTHTLNGDGGDSSWDIVNLTIIPGNIPAAEEILAVYARLVVPGNGDPQQRRLKTTLYRYVNVAHLSIS